MSLKRYHINPETGEPGRCLAKRKCRFGADAAHYPSERDARFAYERTMIRIQQKAHQVTPGEVKPLPDRFIPSPGLITLPPGEYFFGDPYHTISLRDQEGWNRIVGSMEQQYGLEANITDPAKEKNVALGALYNEDPVVALKSYHGAGLHWSMGPIHRIPSDTGLLGMVPISTLENLGFNGETAENSRLGMRVSLDDETNIWRDENGIVIIGGRRLICHNDILASKWFNTLDAADGVNKQSPTGETYEQLRERCELWLKNPLALSS